MSPPRASKVALTTSVEISVLAVAITAAVWAGTALGLAAEADAALLALGVGNAALLATALGGAEAAVFAGAGLNIDGCPVCFCQASHKNTKDMENTTQSMVRRISVMKVSFLN